MAQKVSHPVAIFEHGFVMIPARRQKDEITVTEQQIWVAATVALTAVLLAISVVDLRHFRIPDALSLPLIVSGLLLAWALPDMLTGGPPGQSAFADHLVGASGGFLLFAALGEVIFRRTGQEALGLGDAKLFAAAGAWLGWQALPAVLLIASLGGIGFALILRHRHGPSPIAFGPWIALGFIVMWLSSAAR